MHAELDDLVVRANNSVIMGDLELGLEININCKSGLYLVIKDANLREVRGDIEWNGLTLDASAFEEVLSQLITLGLSDMPAIPLASKITAIPDMESLAVEFDEVMAGDNALYLGLNLVDEDMCGEL